MGALAVAVVGLHVASVHLPEREGMNDVNPGAYVILENGATLGAYRNTLRQPSVYAGVTWSRGPFSLTAGVMRMSKPPRDDLGRPYLRPGATWGPLLVPSWRPVEGLRVTFAPKVRGACGSDVLHLSVEKGF